MPDNTTIFWTVSVLRNTDISVRSFLPQRGMKKGDLSKFIEDAIEALANEAVATVRQARGQP